MDSTRGEYSSSESTFHCFSLLVVSKLLQNVVFFPVSLIFTCVIIPESGDPVYVAGNWTNCKDSLFYESDQVKSKR
jgi:hypothetical protein